MNPVFEHLHELAFESECDGTQFSFIGRYKFIVGNVVDATSLPLIEQRLSTKYTKFVPNLAIFVPPLLRDTTYAAIIHPGFWEFVDRCLKAYTLEDHHVHAFVQHNGSNYHMGILFPVEDDDEIIEWEGHTGNHGIYTTAKKEDPFDTGF